MRAFPLGRGRRLTRMPQVHAARRQPEIQVPGRVRVGEIDVVIDRVVVAAPPAAHHRGGVERDDVHADADAGERLAEKRGALLAGGDALLHQQRERTGVPDASCEPAGVAAIGEADAGQQRARAIGIVGAAARPPPRTTCGWPG